MVTPPLDNLPDLNRSREKIGKRKLFAILVALTLAAGVIRGRDLGKWCFTVDEYYSQQSVSSILEKGIPDLPGGEIYTRGILIQYLTALASLTFSDTEFSARVAPLIFGVLSVPLFFLICRYFLPLTPALLCSFILMFSSWHIEFSRFARMYAPFQFFFFLFLYFLYRGYQKNERRRQVYSWITAFVAIFVYEGSIFLPFILLIPVVLDDHPLNRKNALIIAAFLFLVGMNYVFSRYPIPFRNIPIENPYPFEMTTAKTRAISLPILLPDAALLRAASAHNLFIAGYLGIAAGGLRILFKQTRKAKTLWEAAALGIAVFLPLIYQFSLMMYGLIFLFVAHKSIMRLFLDQKRSWFIYFFITFLYWILVGIEKEGRFSSLGDVRIFGEKMVLLLFGYPRFYDAFFQPFLDVIPVWSSILFAVFAVSVIRYLNVSGYDSRSFLVLVLLSCLILVSLFRTLFKETRYSYFFFPLLYILMYIEANSLMIFGNSKLEAARHETR